MWISLALGAALAQSPVFRTESGVVYELRARDQGVVLDPGLDLSGWTALTVAAEVRVDRHTTYDSLLSYGRVDGVATEAGFTLQLGGSASGAHFNPIQGARGAPARGRLYEPVAPAGSGWHCVVGVWDGQRTSLYVDGELFGISEPAVWDELYDDPENRLLLGRAGGHRWTWGDAWLDGAVRNVAIWDRVVLPGS